jgi:transcriptional regulator with XRE-family HTH domain
MNKADIREVMAALIDTIEAAMAKKGMIHKDLADELGISQQRVSQILSGRYNLTIRTLTRISEALDLKLKIDLHG